MAEIERTRERERGPLKEDKYERALRYYREMHERNEAGPVVIRIEDREQETGRQGHLRFYLDPLFFDDTPLRHWCVFTNEVRTVSGRHRHQGGLVIYVIEGRGYSIVEGERWDWEKGDLMLLPMRPGGIEHQHFNLDDKPSLWIAFIHYPIMEYVAHEITQTQTMPEYKG
jgi:hypothetical protein